MEKNKKKIIVASIAAVCLIYFGFKYFKKNVPEKSQKEVSMKNEFENKVLIQNDDGTISKIDLATGRNENASALEQEDFSGFAGLPEIKNDDGGMQQSGVIVSQDKNEAIVTMISSEGASSYLCDILKKDCQKTEMLSQMYDGLDESLQKNPDNFSWSAWDSAKKMLFGNIISQDSGDVSPVFVCNTENKKCQKTAGFDQKIAGGKMAVVPNGAFSPTLSKFVMISQNDKPNLETGKIWQLLLYSSDNLEKPLQTFDISTIIDRDESVAYDSVYSLAWNENEDKIAIGTARRIFLFDVKSGALSLALIAPTNKDGDFYWDSSRLFLSSDARSIVFSDESSEIAPDLASKSPSNQAEQADVTYINVLKKIDLQNANIVSELSRGPGISLK